MGTLVKQIGFTDKQSVFISILPGSALLLGTLPAVFFIERFGRRYWATIAFPGFFLGLLIIGGFYLISNNLTAPLGTYNLSASQGRYITGLIIYEAFFGAYSTLTWVIPSEVYPTYLRSYGMESSDITLFLCSFLVTYFFSSM